jgi:hypothetical protein
MSLPPLPEFSKFLKLAPPWRDFQCFDIRLFQLSFLFLNILSKSVSQLFFKLICVPTETLSRTSN